MNGRERGPRVLHGPTGTERTAPSVWDPRGRAGGVREGATGGGAKLLERADMSGVSSNFVKKFVWGS
jgi:hypothetical protein